jgi:concentrative nucleoside transporter, CNT family
MNRIFTLFAFLLIVNIGFASNIQDNIIGKWVLHGENDSVILSYEFFDNNIVEIYEDETGVQMFWTITDNKLILNRHIPEKLSVFDSIGFLQTEPAHIIYFSAGNIGKLNITDSLNNQIPGFEEMTFSLEENNILKIKHNGLELELQRFSAGQEQQIEISALSGFTVNSLLRGALGMLVLIFIAWLFSTNRKKISWRVVFIGLGVQALLAIGVLKVPFIQTVFEFVGNIFVKILNFSGEGAAFLLGDLMNVESYGYIFAFQILPTIVFFSALTSVLFYLGIIQKVVYGLAWVMTKALKISGAESLSVAGNIFLGQTESPLMIKAYLEKMNKSEILLVMIGGMATVAGGVLAAYIGFLGGDDPAMRLVFAKHLLAASVMAAPGAVVVSKILCPQTDKVDKNIEVSKEKVGSNFLDAMSNGTTEGLKLAANVAAMLLVFVAFIAMFNFIVGKLGVWTNLNPTIYEFTNGQFDGLSLQFILGYAFAPLMWLIGVSTEDITLVGRLLGEKIIMSEFIGYISLSELKSAAAFANEKSIIMATYMLCGFANFASIGIQIGGIGSLAPGQRKQLSRFGMRALLGGTLASLLSATMVGIIMG